MITNDLLKQIQFIKEIDKIKYIQRRTCLLNSDRPENDAEHSWHLALMAIALSEHANKPVDILRVLQSFNEPNLYVCVLFLCQTSSISTQR